jgi:oligoribonuclease NrnB/cAMP/cGMP phosphodiesterase (DHH superfamily)
MNKVAIIYHKADLDGALSGVIANEKLSLDPNNNITLIPADYGDNFKVMGLEKFDKIYMIDLSDDWVLTHPIISKKIVWIDHHKTAIAKDYKVQQYTVVGVAACRLAYQFFNNDNWSFLGELPYYERLVSEPYVVTLAGEYDIWDLDSPMAKYLNKGITDISFESVQFVYNELKHVFSPHTKESKQKDKHFLESLKNNLLSHFIAKGEGVMDYIRSTEKSLDGGVKVELFGLTGYAYNTHIATSDIAVQKEDFTMVWRYTGGPKIKVSLYSTTKDVSKIAEKFGGGGHAGACGFSIHPHILTQILTTGYP